ncbi:MAG: acyltransferase domain-containing protein [Candidatus Aminicenantes bacterium]|nr:acyltransferase domain-containing protein [Candidatus Aminicenantes bacterium]
MNEQRSESAQTGLEIAVIGMAGRFPGAGDIEAFWENLKNGVESVVFFSDDELVDAGIDPETIKKPNYVKAKGYVEDVQYFDAAFFNYTPHEAEIMDPQVRIFHQCTYHALENAGYDTKTYDGLIGLYAGYSPNISWKLAHFLQTGSGLETLEIGNLNSNHFTSNICYKLNLKGPSVSINTTCSTSLAAIHIACRALLTGEADITLAGGVALTFPTKNGYIYEEGMINSPDGRCRPFDAGANGMASGNGVGVIVLKRLVKAVKDRDFIYAVIKGSAINNDGNRKAGYTAPSVEGQAEVIRAALRVADVDAGSITYVETHGTGTPIGDTIEIEALKKVFMPPGSSYKKRSCALGFVKANIGHMDCAAGVVSFIKTVLALRHRHIPPAVNFTTPNPEIDFENSPFYVNTELKEWESAPGCVAARAGVSAYGIGGTNAHVILEEWPETEPTPPSKEGISHPETDRPQLILLSAKSKSALGRMAGNLAEYLKSTPGIALEDAAYTLQVGRGAFNYRRMLLCRDKDQAGDALLSSEPGHILDYVIDSDNRPVLFMFPSPGDQYINMGLQLYHTFSMFRETMDRCFDILQSILDYNLKDVLYPDEKEQGEEPVNPKSATQNSKQSTVETQNLASQDRQNIEGIGTLVAFIFEYALAQLLISWGIKPHAMAGRDSGEYAAACLAGVFSLQDALTMITAGEELEARIEQLTLKDPKIPFISNATGKWITPEDAVNPRYWVTHLQKTGRFADGFDELTTIENALFLEVGPGETLSTLARQYCPDEASHPVVNLAGASDREIPEIEYLLRKIGELWLYGTKIDWSGFNAGDKRNRVPLPSYPFEKQYYTVDLQLTRMIAEAREGGMKFVKQAPPSSTPVKNRPEMKTPYVPPRNKAEEILARIWQDLLGIIPIGIHDDLPEIGVDSLKAMMFANRFKDELGEVIDVTGLFEAPTIAEFAAYFSSRYPDSTALTGDKTGAAPEIPTNFVMLHRPPGGEGNIFFVHEICGDVGAYLEFCKQSGTRFNCWGIEAEKLKNYAPQNVTIEEIAARYIRQIKQIQPQGPYYLATWSFGGNFGFEMALQLEQMGEELAFLAFFDCSGPNGRTDSALPEHTLETEKSFSKNFFVSTGNEAELEKLDDMGNLWNFAVDFLKTDQALVEGLRQLLIENEKAIPDYHSLTAEELVQFLNAIRTFNYAGSRYIPAGKINTPIHYFPVEDNPEREEYWNDYCRTPVIYHEIRGDHHSIFRDKEQITEFACKFNDVLKQISDKKNGSSRNAGVIANSKKKENIK